MHEYLVVPHQSLSDLCNISGQNDGQPPRVHIQVIRAEVQMGNIYIICRFAEFYQDVGTRNNVLIGLTRLTATGCRALATSRLPPVHQ